MFNVFAAVDEFEAGKAYSWRLQLKQQLAKF
jgi:hypothetical protein